MRHDGLIISFLSDVPVPGYRFVASRAGGPYAATLAVDATAPVYGVSTQIGSDGNNVVDTVTAGFTEVEVGAAVNKGDFVRADSQGRAVVSTQATDKRGGRAMQNGAQAGDIITIEIIKN